MSSAHVTVNERPTARSSGEFTAAGDRLRRRRWLRSPSLIGIDAPTRDLLLANLDNRSASRTVVVHVDLTGTDPATGSAMSSPEYQFPVRVCNGCLVSFATGNDPVQPVQPNCYKPAPADMHVPCAIGQDEQVPCELCVASRPACDPLRP